MDVHAVALGPPERLHLRGGGGSGREGEIGEEEELEEGVQEARRERLVATTQIALPPFNWGWEKGGGGGCGGGGCGPGGCECGGRG